jgi:hypothetical protein
VLATKRIPDAIIIGDDRISAESAYQWATSVQNLLARILWRKDNVKYQEWNRDSRKKNSGP